MALAVLPCRGQEVSQRSKDAFAAANRLYLGGHFAESAHAFEELQKEDGFSATLSLNLGNAYFKAGQLGPALLNYERARYFAPGAVDIDHNLQLTRQEAGLLPNSYPWWELLMRRIPLASWTLALDTGLTLLALALVLSQVSPSHYPSGLPLLRSAPRTIFFFVTPFVLFVAFFSIGSYALEQRQSRQAVIVRHGATLLLSPLADSEKLGSAPEGELVTVDKTFGSYYYLIGRDRLAGWVQKEAVEPVVPGAFDSLQ